jgi:gamma-glutamyltranspeptidase / glutathione hydrolase
MTASTHWLASATGQAVLERGGNAFDAAAAAGFVLHVVEPHLNGPGGDLVGIFSAGGTPVVLNGQGPAPAGATIEHFRSQGLDLVPGAGALAAAVPGAVDAWMLLLRDHGTWELPDVLEYAIGYARDGHPLVAGAAATISRVAELFREHWPSSASLWLADGEAPSVGTVVRNPVWAATLERLLDAATGDSREDRIDGFRREWAQGFVAQEAAEFVRTPHRHSSGTDHAGVLKAQDWAEFRASYEEPLVQEFRGVAVAKSGPFGQGPVLLQALAILDRCSDLDPSTENGAHTVLEALKLALADRDAWYGSAADPEVLEELLSDGYAAGRASLITEVASREFRPGSPLGLAPQVPPLRTDAVEGVGTGEPTVAHHPVSGVLPRDPVADDLARPGVAVRVASGGAAPHHADPDPAAAGRGGGRSTRNSGR